MQFNTNKPPRALRVVLRVVGTSRNSIRTYLIAALLVVRAPAKEVAMRHYRPIGS